MAQHTTQPVADEWVTFPGGELEGKRPKALCPACRASLKAAAAAGAGNQLRDSTRRPVCFQCYRAELDRERALRAAGELDTASEARFQTQLPFEPVNEPRLAMLKAERTAERGVMLGFQNNSAGRFVNARRQAQIAARHALQTIVAGVAARKAAARAGGSAIAGGSAKNSAMDLAIASAIHAAELQLPESWLPFVVVQKAVSR